MPGVRDPHGIRPVRPTEGDPAGTALWQPSRPLQAVTVDGEQGKAAPTVGLRGECGAVAKADDEGRRGHSTLGKEVGILSPILRDCRKDFRSVCLAGRRVSEEPVDLSESQETYDLMRRIAQIDVFVCSATGEK